MPEHEIDLLGRRLADTTAATINPVSTLRPVDVASAVGDGAAVVGRARRAGWAWSAGWPSAGWPSSPSPHCWPRSSRSTTPTTTWRRSSANRRAPTGTSSAGDGLGRDLLSRMVWGARASLLLGVASVLLGLVLGGLLGLVAGYFRGRTDTVFTGAFDVLLSFPQLILALTLVTVFASQEGVSSTRRMVVLILALGIVSVPVLARIPRANTMAWSQREFVQAARALGARNRQIMFAEVLPNVLPAMFSIALLGVAVVIVAEGGLSLLGVGVQLPTPSWGNILSEGAPTCEARRTS